MDNTEYLAPETLQEAISALESAGSAGRILAGGTDLLVQMRGGRVRPSTIVDIKNIPELMAITESGGAFTIGSAVSGATLGEHAKVCAQWPGVVEAFNLIGSTQVQGRASMGGNLCNASPAADSVPALIASGAVCIVEGKSGRRELAVEDVQSAPGKTNLAPDEILVAFEFPKREKGDADAYQRLIPRTEMDIAVVGVGVNLSVDQSGTCTAGRVSVGAVAPTTILVEAAGAALVGTKLTDADLDKYEEAVAAACKPISDKRGTADYRIRAARVLARRTALVAYERATS